MAGPPEAFGFAPLPTTKVDPRWLEVKDARVALKVIGSNLSAQVDQLVNRRVSYTPDFGDSWSPPQQTWTKRIGDCEDYCLLKRAILLNSGFRDDQIVMMLVQDVIARRAHAILLVDDGGWRVLDSYNALTLPLAKVKDYTPIMAFSGACAWLYGRKNR